MSSNKYFSSNQVKQAQIKLTPTFKEKFTASKNSTRRETSASFVETNNPFDIISNVFSFNNQVGKGLLLCLQNQMNLAQIMTDLIQNLEGAQNVETTFGKENASKILTHRAFGKNTPSPSPANFTSRKNNSEKSKNLALITTQVQKFMEGLTTLINFPTEKIEAKVEPKKTEKSGSVCANPQNSQNWVGEVKRSSVPLIQIPNANRGSLTSRKNLEFNLNLTENGKNLTESLQSPSRIKQCLTPQEHLKIDFKNDLKVPKKSDILKLNLQLISPNNFDEMKALTKRKPYFQDSDKPFYSTKNTQSTKEGTKAIENEKEKDDKIYLKPALGTIPRKELFEESFLENQERHHSQDSINLVSTPAMDTDRMLQTPDLDEHALIQNLNNVKAAIFPVKEKKAMKKLLREDYGSEAINFPRGDLGRINERKFLIDAKWWRSWKEYVNFDSHDDSFNMGNMEGYPRPGKISNRSLVKYGIIEDFGQLPGELELKDNLLEHHDYEAVSLRVFETLVEWYGCDFEIIRYLRADPFRNNKIFLDLYPEITGGGETVRKTSRFKSLSPRNDVKVGNIITNIINSNLTNYQKKLPNK